MYMKKIITFIWIGLYLMACNNPVTSPEKINELPAIYPDYIGVTVPVGIAPMNFNYLGDYECLDVKWLDQNQGKSILMMIRYPFLIANGKNCCKIMWETVLCSLLVCKKRINGYNTDLFQCM